MRITVDSSTCPSDDCGATGSASGSSTCIASAMRSATRCCPSPSTQSRMPTAKPRSSSQPLAKRCISDIQRTVPSRPPVARRRSRRSPSLASPSSCPHELAVDHDRLAVRAQVLRARERAVRECGRQQVRYQLLSRPQPRGRSTHGGGSSCGAYRSSATKWHARARSMKTSSPDKRWWPAGCPARSPSRLARLQRHHLAPHHHERCHVGDCGLRLDQVQVHLVAIKVRIIR